MYFVSKSLFKNLLEKTQENEQMNNKKLCNNWIIERQNTIFHEVYGSNKTNGLSLIFLKFI